jgi:hypothetical protein
MKTAAFKTAESPKTQKSAAACFRALEDGNLAVPP